MTPGAASEERTADLIALADALRESLTARDGAIGWAGPYDHGEPPTVEQIVSSLLPRLGQKGYKVVPVAAPPDAPSLRAALEREIATYQPTKPGWDYWEKVFYGMLHRAALAGVGVPQEADPSAAPEQPPTATEGPPNGVMESCTRWHRGGTEHFHYKPFDPNFIVPMNDSPAFVEAERDMLREALNRCAKRLVELLPAPPATGGLHSDGDECSGIHCGNPEHGWSDR